MVSASTDRTALTAGPPPTVHDIYEQASRYTLAPPRGPDVRANAKRVIAAVPLELVRLAMSALGRHGDVIGRHTTAKDLAGMLERADEYEQLMLAYRAVAQSLEDEVIRLRAEARNEAQAVKNDVDWHVRKRDGGELAGDRDAMLAVMRAAHPGSSAARREAAVARRVARIAAAEERQRRMLVATAARVKKSEAELEAARAKGRGEGGNGACLEAGSPGGAGGARADALASTSSEGGGSGATKAGRDVDASSMPRADAGSRAIGASVAEEHATGTASRPAPS